MLDDRQSITRSVSDSTLKSKVTKPHATPRRKKPSTAQHGP
jgi:hypothetical protein